MPDNHFEHNAKQQLDELKFNPSESVWLNVEAQIGKDKRRRKLLLWIPLACLLLGSGAWFLLSGKSKTVPAGISQVAEDNQKKSYPDAGGTTESGVPASGSRKAEPVENAAAKNANSADLRTVENRHSGMKNSKAGTRNKKQSKSVSNGRDDVNQLAEHLMKTPEPSNTTRADARDQKTSDAVAEQTTSGDLLRGQANASSTDSAKQAAITDSAHQQPLAAAKTAAADSLRKTADKKSDLHHKNRLQWGIEADGGLSSLPGKSTENYLYYSPSGPSGNPSAAPGYGGPEQPKKKSFSFSLGLRLQKKLDASTTVFSGIRYSYASVKIASGQLVDAPLSVNNGSLGLAYVGSYYAVVNNSGYNYRNQYHFVEIPLGIEEQFSERSRFSVNAGISASWLFATNALLYNTENGIYFKHNAYLNKMQWNVSGGIQYRLLQTASYSLKIGPQIQYGLTSVVDKEMPYTQHRLFGGIQVLLIRNRK